MPKRLLLIILIILTLGGVGSFLSCSRTEVAFEGESEAIKVVPDDAVWIIESHSIPALLKLVVQSDPLLPAIQQLGNIQPYLQTLRNLDSLITRDSRFKQQFENRPVVLSFHQTGKNLYQFLLIFRYQGSNTVENAGNLITALSGRNGQWSKRTYNGQEINRITFGTDAIIQGVSLSESNKYLIISPSPILLENALRQMTQTEGLYTTAAFRKLSQTAGKEAVAHVYLNLKAMPSWLSGWMNPALKKKMEKFTRYGDWASLDLTLHNDAVWMSGFALEGDTLNSYLNLFKNQKPRKLEAERFLPGNTAAYYTIAVDQPAPFLKGLSDYLGGGEAGRKRKNFVEKANAVMGADVVKAWTELEFREITIGYVCGVADQSVHSIAMVQVKNGKQAIEKLTIRAGAATAVKPPRVPARNKDYSIYNMPFEGLPEILGGTFFSGVSGNYFTIIENQVVLADEMQVLEDVLHKYSLNRTLSTDAVFLSLGGVMQATSNASFFAVPLKARPLLESILNPGAVGVFLANDQFIQKTSAVGLQFSSGGSMSLHNLFFSFAEVDYTKPQTIWESKLDAKIATKPFIVTNHLTHEKEIIVQDERQNLYLLSSSGRILWKKNIGERIRSTIYQVDIMKNGKLQYLFSTNNAIYLMDRNGAILPKYPVKLKSTATNGITLMDFDGTRDYRILVACADNKVYMLDRAGNPLKGWPVGPVSGPVTHPVQWFRIQDKDYLVFCDALKVYFLDRKGKAKVIPDRDFAVSPNNLVQCEAGNLSQGPRFRITDADGNVNTIQLDGTVESKKLGEFSADHYFFYDDINRDGLNEYVYIDKNRLEIFSQSGEKLITRKFSGNVTGLPEFYVFNAKTRRLGLTISSQNEIMVLNGDGSLESGFPLYGNTSFTVGKLGQSAPYENLLAGSSEGYLYNYAIK